MADEETVDEAINRMREEMLRADTTVHTARAEAAVQEVPPPPDPFQFFPPPPGREELDRLPQMDAIAVMEQARQRANERLANQRPVAVPLPTPQPVVVEPHPDTVGIKLTAEVLLGRSLLDLLKQAPNNPTIRTMISKHCRKTVPVELVGVDEIIAWIEANVTLPPPVLNEQVRPGIRPQPGAVFVDPAVVERAERPDYVMVVNARNSGTESGTARWSGGYVEDRDVRLTRDEFENMAASADDFDELIESIRDHALQELSENGGDWESTGRDYEDHETVDSDCDNSEIQNHNEVSDLAVRLLVQMRDRIENDEERDAFNERFGL